MNQINLVGRITRDLELRKTASEKSVCEFNLAVNRVGSENADFITCVVWNQQADNLAKYQGKGSLIGVSGSLRVEQYQDKEGNNRYKTYVLASNIEYLSSKPKENEILKLKLEEIIAETDTDRDAVLKAYKVKDMNEMTMDQMQQAINHISKKVA